MKRFIIIGVISVGVVVCLLLACAEVSTNAQGRPEKMIITVDTRTGRVVMPIVDEHGREATRMTPEEVEAIYNSENGFRHIGTILYTHSSPGCSVYCSGGRCYKVCH